MIQKAKEFAFSLIYKSIDRLPLAYLQKLLDKIFDKIEEKENKYITWHKRPKNAESVRITADAVVDLSGTWIVMQGPLVREDDFTLQTLKLYRSFFKDVKIILSLWNDEDKNYLESHRECYDILLLNAKPTQKGHHNINMQIESAGMGVKRACEENAKYIMRTRTDQRIYNPNCFNYFISLLNLFPETPKPDVNRLVVTNMYTLKFRPFGISDMLMFGYAKDVNTYWNIPWDKRSQIDLTKAKTVYDFADKRICETYLATEYLTKVGSKWSIDLAESWKSYKDYFIIIDAQSIDLFWIKYDRRTEYRFDYYDCYHSYQVAKMSDWLPRVLNNNTRVEFSLETLEGQPASK